MLHNTLHWTRGTKFDVNTAFVSEFLHAQQLMWKPQESHDTALSIVWLCLICSLAFPPNKYPHIQYIHSTNKCKYLKILHYQWLLARLTLPQWFKYYCTSKGFTNISKCSTSHVPIILSHCEEICCSAICLNNMQYKQQTKMLVTVQAYAL